MSPFWQVSFHFVGRENINTSQCMNMQLLAKYACRRGFCHFALWRYGFTIMTVLSLYDSVLLVTARSLQRASELETKQHPAYKCGPDACYRELSLYAV